MKTMPELSWVDNPMPASADGGWWARFLSPRRALLDRTTTLDPHRSVSLARRLLYLIAILRIFAGTGGVIVAVLLAREMHLSLAPLEASGIVLGLGLLSLLARRHIERGTSFTENVFLVQVLGDVVLLTLALALVSGFRSAFDDFFLMPLVVGAYTLGMRRFLIVVAAVVACLVFLSAGSGPALAFPGWADIAAHVAVAAMVTYLAFAAAKISRNHERYVAQMREEALSSRSAAALHGVAAQAAHSINTPLATMALAVDELRQGILSPREHHQVLATLTTQIEICKTRLARLLVTTGGGGEQAQLMGVDEMLRAVCEEFELMHPAKTVSLQLEGDDPAPSLAVERSLFDALIVLLEDCGTEPPHNTTVAAHWGRASVTIRMVGSGSWEVSRVSFPAPAAPPPLGSPAGNQQSLTLAASIIDRFGGSVTYRPGAEGKWVQVVLMLPATRSAQ